MAFELALQSLPRVQDSPALPAAYPFMGWFVFIALALGLASLVAMVLPSRVPAAVARWAPAVLLGGAVAGWLGLLERHHVGASIALLGIGAGLDILAIVALASVDGEK